MEDITPFQTFWVESTRKNRNVATGCSTLTTRHPAIQPARQPVPWSPTIAPHPVVHFVVLLLTGVVVGHSFTVISRASGLPFSPVNLCIAFELYLNTWGGEYECIHTDELTCMHKRIKVRNMYGEECNRYTGDYVIKDAVQKWTRTLGSLPCDYYIAKKLLPDCVHQYLHEHQGMEYIQELLIFSINYGNIVIFTKKASHTEIII